MSKLTLSVDEQVVARAKRYAARHGTSVSRLVERYLDRLTSPPETGSEPPVLSRLRGVLTDGDPRDHARYLEEKYR